MYDDKSRLVAEFGRTKQHNIRFVEGYGRERICRRLIKQRQMIGRGARYAECLGIFGFVREARIVQ